MNAKEKKNLAFHWKVGDNISGVESVTNYFKNEILRKRDYLTVEICRKVIQHHIKREFQPDGRIRFWGRAKELKGRYLRVVTLENSFTIHNAFIDRGFKP